MLYVRRVEGPERGIVRVAALALLTFYQSSVPLPSPLLPPAFSSPAHPRQKGVHQPVLHRSALIRTVHFPRPIILPGRSDGGSGTVLASRASGADSCMFTCVWTDLSVAGPGCCGGRSGEGGGDGPWL